MTALIVLFLLLIIGLGAALFIILTDWRAVFQKHFGEDYHHGEAVFITNGKRSYSRTELWHVGVYSMSYWRQEIIDGKKMVFDDIVPNPPAGVPMQYDSNGRRMYWPILGNVICANKEAAGYQFTNYPPEMMSADMADRIGVSFGRSVRSEGGGGMVWLVVGFVVILAIGGIFFMTRPRSVQVQAPTANVTATVTTTPAGVIYGVPVTTTPAGGR